MLNIFKRNKKLFNCICTVLLLFANLPVHAEEAKIELNDAITSSSKEIINYFNKKEFKKYKVPIAVVVSNTETEEMAEYLTTQFEAKIKKSKNCQLLARSKTSQAALKAEIDYQYSGFVSDDDMVTIGQGQGAKYIVSVSFQQLDKKKILTVKTLKIETAEIITGPQIYNIADSKEVEQLLKNTRELVTLNDYLDEIEKWKLEKRKAEQKRDEEIVIGQGEIRSEYEQRIADVNQKQYPKNKSDEFIRKDRAENIKYLETERDKKLSDIKKTITERYAAEIQNYETKKESVIENMLGKEFRLRGQDQIFIRVDDFERNKKPQYFPVSFESHDPNISYKGEFKIEIKQDNDAEFERINEPKEKKDIIGQLLFKLERIKGTDEFFVRVRKVSLVKKSTGAELFSAFPMMRTNIVPRKDEKTSLADNGNFDDVSRLETVPSSAKTDTNAKNTAQSEVKTKARNIALAAAGGYWDEDSGQDDQDVQIFDNGFVIDGKRFDFTGEVLVKSSQLESDVVFGKYEMTQELYKFVTGKNPSVYQEDAYITGHLEFDERYETYTYNGKTPSEQPPEYLPVENITWFEAVAFCNQFTQKVSKDKNSAGYKVVYYSDKKLTKPYTPNDAKAKKQVFVDKTASGWRLPTTDEWEVAAGRKEKSNTDGEKSTYFVTDYSGGNKIDELAWYYGNSVIYDHIVTDRRHQEVGQKAANENGLYDMTGNVWEWCWSECGEYSWTWSEYDVFIKGGCFYNDERQCRLDWVARQVPDRADKGIGFRICRTAPDSASSF